MNRTYTALQHPQQCSQVHHYIGSTETVCCRKPLRGRSAFEAEAGHRIVGACKSESRETRADEQVSVSLCDHAVGVEPEHNHLRDCLGEKTVNLPDFEVKPVMKAEEMLIVPLLHNA